MAISRFNQPVGFQTQNTYVPIPFEEMAQAAIYRQQKSDIESDRLDKADDYLSQLQAMPNSLADQKILDDARSDINNLWEKSLTVDLSDNVEARRWQRDIKSTINTKAIRDVVASRAGYDAWKQEEAKSRARGTWRDGLNTDPSTIEGGYNSANMGIFTGLPTAYEDYQKTANLYFAPLRDSILYNPDGSEKYEDGYRLTGIDMGDIAAVAKLNRENFLNTTPGKQAVQLRQGVEYDPNDIERNLEVSEEILLETGLSSLRKGYTGGKQGGKSMEDIFKEFYESQGWIPESGKTTGRKVADQLEVPFPEALEKNSFFNKLLKSIGSGMKTGGEFIGNAVTEHVLRKDGKYSEMEINDYMKYKKEQQSIKKTKKEQAKTNKEDGEIMKLIDTLHRYGVEDMSMREGSELLNTALLGQTTREVGYTLLSDISSKVNIEQIISDRDGREFFVSDANGYKKTKGRDQKSVTFAGAAKALKLSEEKFKEQLRDSEVIKFTIEGGVKPGQFMIPVIDGKKNTYQVFIDAGAKASGMSEVAHSLNRDFLNMDYSPKLLPNRTEEGQYEYTRIKFDVDRDQKIFNNRLQSYITSNKLTEKQLSDQYYLDEIFEDNGETIMDHIYMSGQDIMNSGIIGTDWNYTTGPKPKDTPSKITPEMMQMFQKLANVQSQ